MSISSDRAGAGPDLPARALAWLRDRPDPFDSLVRPQRPDEHFLDHHEPTVHQAEYQKLAAAVAAYRPGAFRLKPYRPGSGLPDSRAVTVVGPRGAGKTHLLEALAHRTEPPQLLIRPDAFEPHVPFEEALVGHLTDALRGGDRPPLRWVAENLTARLVRQALAATPAEAAREMPSAEKAERVAQFLRHWEKDDGAVRRR